jgi:hypothetical protein
MRTTFIIADDLYRQVKVCAAEQGRTVTSLVEQALQKVLDDDAGAQVPERQPVTFHTITGPLVDAHLDLTSNVAVLDHLDRVDPDFTLRALHGYDSDDEVARYLKVKSQHAHA